MDLATYFDLAVPFFRGERPAEPLTDAPHAPLYPRVVRGTALEALTSLYPLLLAALDDTEEADAEGDDPELTCGGRGRALMGAFLDELPPTQADISRIGANLGPWLSARGMHDSLIELCDVEDAEREAATSPARFEPEHQPLNPTLVVRRYHHPVVAFARAHRRGHAKPDLATVEEMAFAFVREAASFRVKTVPLVGLRLAALALAAGEVQREELGLVDERALATVREELIAAQLLGRAPA